LDCLTLITVKADVLTQKPSYKEIKLATFDIKIEIHP